VSTDSTSLTAPLDAAALAARNSLYEAGVPEPDVLLFLGTGTGALSVQLQNVRSAQLGRAESVPPCWRGRDLTYGKLGKGVIWLIEDRPEEVDEEGPAWQRSFPLWLAAASGAQLAIVTAAGASLDVHTAPPPGSLAVLCDHINLSGGTPLVGLGETHLGPLFPDQTHLHHAGMRDLLLEYAKGAGIPLAEAVAACIPGPSIDTPAELAYLATTGAEVVVQDLASNLIAAAHAGLGLVTIVAVTDDGTRPVRMSQLVQESERLAPALDELIMHLLPAIIEEAQAWAAEEAPLDEDLFDEGEEQ